VFLVTYDDIALQQEAEAAKQHRELMEKQKVCSLLYGIRCSF